MPHNRRRNPFTGAEMPVPIQGETHIVPTYSPHWVWLREIPLQATPPTVTVHDSSTQTDVTGTGDSGSCWIDEENPTVNHSGENTMFTGREAEGSTGRARALVQFDLGALPAGQVVSAVLRLYLEDTPGEGGEEGENTGAYPNERPIGVHQVLDAWDDDTATWVLQPDHDPVAQAVAYVRQANWYEWDLTSLVLAWLASPTSNHGIMVKDGDEVSAIGTRRQWTASPAGSNVPTLRILTTAGAYAIVAPTVTPTAGECALAYDVGAIQFHPSAAGRTVEVSYQGTGSPVRVEDLNSHASLIDMATTDTLEVTSGVTALAPGVYSYRSLYIAAGAKLTVDGSGILAIGVTGDAIIEGAIDLDGCGYAGGTRLGSNAPGLPGDGPDGIGGGGGGTTSGGGGGGSSVEGDPGSNGAFGGRPHHLLGGKLWRWGPPLLGGGGGAGSGANIDWDYCLGGNGGGGLLLQVLGVLLVTSGASISARGLAGGSDFQYGGGSWRGWLGGGGGGGGTIWLRASTLEVNATPDASGGTGGMTSGTTKTGGDGAPGYVIVEGI